MNKRWLIILLLVSFAFNLAVLGSFIYLRVFFGSRFCPPPPSPHLSQGRPDMPFKEMWDRLPEDDEIPRLRDEFMNTKIGLMKELAKDPINEETIKNILEQSLINQSALERKLADRLIMLRKTMTAEEAQEYFGKRLEWTKNPRHDRRKPPHDNPYKRRNK